MKLRQTVVSTLAALAVLGGTQPASAQLAARSADEWIKTLDSPNRVAGLKVGETLEALKLKPGVIVADVGAGSGIFTMPIARAVRPGGTVYAVDVDEELLHHIAEAATEQGIINVQTVYGEYTDPILPVPVDLAFISDVLHHIEDRTTYLKNLAKYIKPTGRIALIDFFPEKGGHRGQPDLQISKEQASAMMAAIGFAPVEDIPLFDDKYFVIYGKK
jgi:ubiquinone/menaquinone biosynthesis C-methylase UbiE